MKSQISSIYFQGEEIITVDNSCCLRKSNDELKAQAIEALQLSDESENSLRQFLLTSVQFRYLKYEKLSLEVEAPYLDNKRNSKLSVILREHL